MVFKRWHRRVCLLRMLIDECHMHSQQHNYIVCERCKSKHKAPRLPLRCCGMIYLSADRPGIQESEYVPKPVSLECTHRGDVLRHETCKLCGNREQFVPIFACDIHGECSLRKFKFREKAIKSCLSCEERQEPDPDKSPSQLSSSPVEG